MESIHQLVLFIHTMMCLKLQFASPLHTSWRSEMCCTISCGWLASKHCAQWQCQYQCLSASSKISSFSLSSNSSSLYCTVFFISALFFAGSVQWICNHLHHIFCLLSHYTAKIHFRFFSPTCMKLLTCTMPQCMQFCKILTYYTTSLLHFLNNC